MAAGEADLYMYLGVVCGRRVAFGSFGWMVLIPTALQREAWQRGTSLVQATKI